MNRFLVIIGPSGVGKTSLVRELKKLGVVSPFPSWTTRPPRPEEREEQIDHIFVSDSEFEKQKQEGRFLETVSLFGLPYQYGLPPIKAASFEMVTVILLRAPLLDLLKNHYKDYKIYQIEDSVHLVSERLQAREQNGEMTGDRLKQHEAELAMGRGLADRIFENDSTIAALADKVAQAIKKDFKQE